MATPRDTAVRVHGASLKAQADAIETRIEDEIAHGHLCVSFYLNQLPEGTTFEALKEVADRYRKVGWHVRVGDNQRDGAYIVIDADNPA